VRPLKPAARPRKDRHRQDEEAKRKAEAEAKKRFGEAEARKPGHPRLQQRARCLPRAPPALPPTAAMRMKVRARSAAAPAALPALPLRQRPPQTCARKQRGRLTLVTALNADDVRERSIASFRRRTSG